MFKNYICFKRIYLIHSIQLMGHSNNKEYHKSRGHSDKEQESKTLKSFKTLWPLFMDGVQIPQG